MTVASAAGVSLGMTAQNRPTIFRAGDMITCTNGHPIAKFTQDIVSGQAMRFAEQLGEWQQAEPNGKPYDRIKCEVCNAQWIKPSPDSFYLQFYVGEWRPTPDTKN